MNQPQRRVGVTSRLRLRGHDYAEPASYVVTLCTEQRICLFGEVVEDTMMRSTAGEVIASWWESIPIQFPAATLDAMIVMPNHLHGIIMIGVDDPEQERTGLPTLSRIMQWFKSMTTVDYARGVRSHGWSPFPTRLWQPGFYDHLIRDDRDLDRIRSYIESNPAMWEKDEYGV